MSSQQFDSDGPELIVRPSPQDFLSQLEALAEARYVPESEVFFQMFSLVDGEFTDRQLREILHHSAEAFSKAVISFIARSEGREESADRAAEFCRLSSAVLDYWLQQLDGDLDLAAKSLSEQLEAVQTGADGISPESSPGGGPLGGLDRSCRPEEFLLAVEKQRREDPIPDAVDLSELFLSLDCIFSEEQLVKIIALARDRFNEGLNDFVRSSIQKARMDAKSRAEAYSALIVAVLEAWPNVLV